MRLSGRLCCATMGCSRLFLTACHNAPLVVLHKADASLLCGLGRMHERADGIQNAGDGLVVSAERHSAGHRGPVRLRSQIVISK